jgi:hypothetical protein
LAAAMIGALTTQVDASTCKQQRTAEG